MTETFKSQLTVLINRWCRENGSNTPDFVLADHLVKCLINFDEGVKARDRWYGSKQFSDDDVRRKCAQDLALYGTAMVKQHSDGVMEYVDPTDTTQPDTSVGGKNE